MAAACKPSVDRVSDPQTVSHRVLGFLRVAPERYDFNPETVFSRSSSKIVPPHCVSRKRSSVPHVKPSLE